jgi:SP family general alpha glucoside:H+ symporter-like MFS transporter
MSTLNYTSNNNAVEDEKDVKQVYDQEHVESAAAGGTVIAQDFGQYIHDASDAVTGQKEMSIRQALSTYRKGVIFSIIFSSAIIMEGYDTLLLGQFFANQAFAKRFGIYNPAEDRYEIQAKWQTGLSASASVSDLPPQSRADS